MRPLESSMERDAKHYDTVPVAKAYELHDEIIISGLGPTIVPRAVAHDRGKIYQRVNGVDVVVEPTFTHPPYYKVSLLQRSTE